jgi:putative ATPase
VDGELFMSEVAPLADRMRPRCLEEVVGQGTDAQDSSLRRAILCGNLPSMIFWGPPGSGKTSLARLVADHQNSPFVTFSAVLSGVRDVRAVTAEARVRRKAGESGTVLFVDEIHRFNKSQQDAFLPHVEDGTIVLIGATTENPSFSLNAALLSRCQVFTLDALAEADLMLLARRGLDDPDRGLAASGLDVAEDGLRFLARTSHGDARSMYNRLETLVASARRESAAPRTLSLAEVERLVGQKAIFHDRAGDEHYNLISAFHKAVRGGDPQASLYWLARMMVAGEDPLFILRRMVRMATEDIGLADPRALEVAMAATDSYRFLGSPEGDLSLASCAVYLATAPKSNAIYESYGAAVDEVKRGAVYPVPKHIRNAPTRLMKEEGYGSGYRYPHDHPYGLVRQGYLPTELRGRTWYEPRNWGYEHEIRKRLAVWEKLLQEREEEMET